MGCLKCGEKKKKSNSKILFPNKISFQDGGAMDHIRIWSSLLCYITSVRHVDPRNVLGVWGKVVQRNCTVIMRRQKEEQWVSSVSFPITTNSDIGCYMFKGNPELNDTRNHYESFENESTDDESYCSKESGTPAFVVGVQVKFIR